MKQLLQQLAEHCDGTTTKPLSLFCLMMLLSGDLVNLSMLMDCSHSQVVTGRVAMIWKSVRMLGKKSPSVWSKAFSGMSSSEAI